MTEYPRTRKNAEQWKKRKHKYLEISDKAHAEILMARIDQEIAELMALKSPGGDTRREL